MPPYSLPPARAAVAAAGPLLTIIACFVMCFIWCARGAVLCARACEDGLTVFSHACRAIPMGYFTAEMSSMFDENGGGILWVEGAFGPLAGWMNAYNQFLASMVDLPVYVVRRRCCCRVSHVRALVRQIAPSSGCICAAHLFASCHVLPCDCACCTRLCASDLPPVRSWAPTTSRPTSAGSSRTRCPGTTPSA
jgi:hypothetical protein